MRTRTSSWPLLLSEQLICTGTDHLLLALEIAMGPKTLGLVIHAVTPRLTLAPVVPAMAAFIDLHEASIAASHVEARRLAALLAG